LFLEAVGVVEDIWAAAVALAAFFLALLMQ
jgi:hypothetical protein